MSFTNATLTAANAYELTALYRGMNGTRPAAHGTGAPFARLDKPIVTYDIPAGLTGQVIYFKFQSFNAFGGGTQDLSDCAVYSIIVGSAGTSHPITIQLQSGVPLDLGPVNVTPTISDDFGPGTQAVGDLIDLGELAVIRAPDRRPDRLGRARPRPGPVADHFERRLRRDRRPADPHLQPWDDSMSEQLQLRRGTAAQIAANTPAAGEVWVDTDHNRLVVGDGSTLGGSPCRR